MGPTPIEPRAVREALRAIRYGKTLSGSPLLALDLVATRLQDEGMPNSQESRAWALARILHEVAREKVGGLRGKADSAAGDDRTPERELDLLEGDFRRGHLDLQAWSALHFRYFAASRVPMGDVADRIGVSAMTFQRRQNRGHELLAVVLQGLERDASQALRQPHNIPHALTRFIGREQEMSQVRDLLAVHRMVTLTGPGGIGKSRLAMEIGRDSASDYGDGVWLVELGPLDDGVHLASAVAAALDVREVPGRPLAETLARHLADRHLLLLMDNCEHLASECAELVSELLRGCASLQVLATSQSVLGIEGEAAWRVPTMAVPGPAGETRLTRLMHVDAVRLFAERARTAAPGFRVTEENKGHVGRICRTLEGVPLAIELACPRLRVLSLAELDERLADRLAMLRDGRRPTRPQHESLRATLDWSYDLLSDKEQTLLRRLTVFRGGWTLQAAEAVCASSKIGKSQVLESMEQLAAKSFVSVLGGAQGPRYKMMAVARQYAAERIDSEGELIGTKNRHLEYFRSYAETHVPRLKASTEAEASALLDSERGNFRAALRWAKGLDEPEPGFVLGTVLGDYWNIHADWSEAEILLRGLVEARAGMKATPGRAGALRWLGVAAMQRSDFVTARVQLDECLEILREVGERRDQCWPLLALASMHRRESDFESAKVRLEEAVKIAREIDDRMLITAVLHNLGVVHDQQGHHAEAQKLFEDLVKAAREVGERNLLAAALNNLGTAILHQGDYEAAQARYDESLTISRATGNREAAAFALGNLGSIAEIQGDLEAAQAHHEQSMAIKADLGNRHGVGISLRNLGVVAHRTGDYEAARERFNQSLALGHEIGDRVRIASSLQGLGDVAVSEGDWDAADQNYRASMAINLELGTKKTTYEVLEGLATVAANRYGYERALRITGAASALRKLSGTVREPVGTHQLGSLHDTLADAVGIDSAQGASSQGAALTLDEAVAYALGEVTWDELAPVVAERLAVGEGAERAEEDATEE